MTRRLRLVHSLPPETLRLTAIGSYRAARLSAARDRCTLRLNHLSMAGFLLLVLKDTQRAIATVEGSDDFAARVRSYLNDVSAQEQRAKTL